MGKVSDLTGQKFNRLTVIEFNGLNTKNKALWICRCDCGKEVVIIGRNLINGNTKSCGCYNLEKIMERNTKHNMRHSRLYDIWCAMKDRCYREKSKIYKYYGAKGITVCDEWRNNFAKFKEWAINNGYGQELTIDRIDGTKGYEPDNCQWITLAEQQRRNKVNSRLVTINGVTKWLYDWADIYGISRKLAKSRYDEGKRGEDIFAGRESLEAIQSQMTGLQSILKHQADV